MTLPVLVVEMAFGSDPMATAPAWVDVTASLADAPKITRGRNDAWSEFRTGKAVVRLNATSAAGVARWLDPTSTAGPYYGQLRPKVPIRISAVWSGTTYRMFTGWVSAFPVQVEGEHPLAGVVELVAYDGLEIAAAMELTDDLYGGAITAAGGLVWWCREVSTRWVDSVAGNYGLTATGAVRSSSTLSPGLQSQAVGAGTVWFTPANTYNRAAGSPWTFGVWFSSTSTSQPITTHDTDYAFVSRTWTSLNATGRFEWRTLTGAFGGSYESKITSTLPLNDGRPHWVVVVCTGSAVTLYVDGVADTTATLTTGSLGPSWSFAVSRALGDGVTFVDPAAPQSITAPTTMFRGSVQELTIAEDVWTAAEIATAYAYATGDAYESSAARLTRVLDAAGWPAAWRDITTTSRAVVGSLLYTGQRLLSTIRDIERSEQGRIFVAGDGRLTFRSRYWHQEDTRGNTPQATFSDDGDPTAHGWESWRYVETDTDVRNSITVTTPTTQARSTDSTSRTTYGPQSETVRTILSTFEQARDMAAGLVYWWRSAVGRIAPFWVDTVDPGALNWGQLLGLELGDRIRCEATPFGAGAQVVRDLLVDAIEWEIGAVQWRLRLAGGPVPPSFFRLDFSTLGGPDPLGF